MDSAVIRCYLETLLSVQNVGGWLNTRVDCGCIKSLINFNCSTASFFSWKPIEEYIYQQFDQYFKDESGLNRRNIKDNRVHCCLYFISPYGRGYACNLFLQIFLSDLNLYQCFYSFIHSFWPFL